MMDKTSVKNSKNTAKTVVGRPFRKGRSGNPAGRPKGAINKVTNDVRAAIRIIAEQHVDDFGKWLKRVALKDPAKAADLYLRMIEYHIPKLQRTDLTSGDKPRPNYNQFNFINMTKEEAAKTYERLSRG